MAEAEYQRLTRAHPRSGFAVAFAARSSLWLGKDHLLCIDSTGFSESYKRFYFRAPKIAAIAGEMVKSPEILRRRLREGIEFFRFLRERREPAH